MSSNVQLNALPHAEAARREPRMNALKHGLRSQAVVLPGEDLAEFQALRQDLYDDHRPRTRREARCVEAMANHDWVMERNRRLREVYYGKLTAVLLGGPDGAAGSHCETDPHRWQHSAIDCTVQERRLQRLRDQELRKLEALQLLRRTNLLADAEAGGHPRPWLQPGDLAQLLTAQPVEAAPAPVAAPTPVPPAAHPASSASPPAPQEPATALAPAEAPPELSREQEPFVPATGSCHGRNRIYNERNGAQGLLDGTPPPPRWAARTGTPWTFPESYS